MHARPGKLHVLLTQAHRVRLVMFLIGLVAALLLHLVSCPPVATEYSGSRFFGIEDRSGRVCRFRVGLQLQAGGLLSPASRTWNLVPGSGPCRKDRGAVCKLQPFIKRKNRTKSCSRGDRREREWWRESIGEGDRSPGPVRVPATFRAGKRER